ncbi:hypothetical protein [uncultured Clostridium sp.]|uniref:hypothetical protein n=1 Tax=uncultured Clostridium sp. TaxID=59620 RepID=UPI0025CF0941|nr:hypothetical protein [uncultured Clostridium sp.]
MKRRLIDFICLTIKYMPQLLCPHKKTYKCSEDFYKINKERIYDEIAADFTDSNDINFTDSDKKSTVENIISGCGTLKDYKIINAYKVNEENIGDINEFLKKRKSLNKDDLKKEANSAAITLIRINEGNGTIYNYKKFDIDVIPSELHIINKFISIYKYQTGRNLTISEIRDAVFRITMNIDKSLDKINEGIGQREDYEAIGINDIKKENINDINMFLKNKNIKTPNKIRSEIKRFLNALSKISQGIGTTNNYNTVGLNIEGKRLKIINTILKSIYERENQELSVKEIIDISHNIIDNFFGRNGLEKINKNLIVSGKLEKEFI